MAPSFLSSRIIAAALAALAFLAVTTEADLIVNCVPSGPPTDECGLTQSEDLKEQILEMTMECAREGSEHKFDDSALSGHPEWVKLEFPTRRALEVEDAAAAPALRGVAANNGDDHNVETFEQAMRRLSGTCAPWVWAFCDSSNVGIQYNCCILTNGACTYCSNFPGFRRRNLGEGDDDDGAEMIPYLSQMAETCTEQFKEIVKGNEECLGSVEGAKCHVLDMVSA